MLLASNPLPCILTFSEEEQCICCFSINGQLLKLFESSIGNIISPIIIHDSVFNDRLLYANNYEKSLIIQSFPEFEEINSIPLEENVTTIKISPNGQFGILGNENGTCTMIHSDRKSVV